MEDTIAMYIDVETLVETKVRSTPKYIQTPPLDRVLSFCKTFLLSAGWLKGWLRVWVYYQIPLDE